MSTGEGLLRRSKSLLHRRPVTREPHDADEEEALPNRPVKQPFVLTQVVRDDSSTGEVFRAELPCPIQLQRNTWPVVPRDRRPGSYFFAETPTLTRTPWELERHKRQPQWSGSRNLSPQVFEQLPQEIYQCIVNHVIASHATSSHVDVAATYRALRNLCLVSRRWARVSTECLYRELWIPSSAPASKRKLSVARAKSRLDLLLRTLTEAPALTSLVRQIRITNTLRDELCGQRTSDGQRCQALEMLTNVIARCTEIEGVSGYAPVFDFPYSDRYTASTDRYIAVLSDRSRLLDHVWLLDAKHTFDNSVGYFVDIHNKWQWLETLIMCGTSITSVGRGLISAITSRLWSLKQLAICRFSREDFHNGTLLALPPLKSLRLEDLDGVNDQGLEQLALARISFSLESLTLVNLDISSLRTFQTLFAHLTHLKRFRLVQERSPSLLVGLDPSSAHASLLSTSLRYLHWDTLIPGPATEAIATSIRLNRLPNLRVLKAPSDPDGALQALCRPIPHLALAASDLPFLKSIDPDRYTRSLRLSQLQAQLRIRESKLQPSFNVVVEDQDAQTQHTHVIGAYLGDVTSRIEYSLEPDVEGSTYALERIEDAATPETVNLAGERRISYRALF